eukprot:1503069-Pleurochrysis_carterae.AAC.1
MIVPVRLCVRRSRLKEVAARPWECTRAHARMKRLTWLEGSRKLVQARCTQDAKSGCLREAACGGACVTA